ncbi:MAG: MATE family efflux transporter [Christensenellaceae bacterium]|nr:MATE family efflux transporter [Christensenellaceae bacterium]
MSTIARIKAFFGVQDMTIGKPITGLLKFSIPLLIGNLAQQLYNTVDSIVVGRYIGDTALAAVGTAGPILNLLLVLFMGVATGASILSAQYFGAKDRATLNKVVGCAIVLTFASGILMMIIGYFASPTLIAMVDPPENVAIGAVTYLQIIFIGILGGAMYNILSGVLRGLGDSVFPLFYLILASLLNIVLDILFVSRFNMGIAGVAWATIIAQGISGALCLIRLCTMRSVCDVNWKTLHPDKRLTIQLCRLGLPAGITQAIFSMSAIVVQGLTNSMGEAMIAANTAIMRVDGFAMMPNFTFGTAATTFVGQNIGARRADRIRQGNKSLLALALSCSTVLVACILLFGHQLMGMFTSTPETLAIGTSGLRWLALGYICFSVSQVLQGNMRGAGETMIPMWISIITTVVLRMPLAYALAWLTRSELHPNGAPVAIFASLLISWIFGMILSVIAYWMGLWRRKLPEDMRNAI